MAVTITLQAASDAIMTNNGLESGLALADDDLRKMYGLPNMYVTSTDKLEFVGQGKNSTAGETNSTLSTRYRWDIIDPPPSSVTIIKQTNYIASGLHETHLNTINAVTASRVHEHQPPTTTAFQLRCDSLEHTIDDMAAVSPLPAFDNVTGSRHDAYTPGQLNNVVVSLGMRTETIRMSGFLMDEGICSPSNPRKQVIFNIARLQYLKSGRSGNMDRWGGPGGGPLNPRSYPCLTIYDSSIGTSGAFDSMGLQPSGNDLVYRGVITNLSFRQEGGRPNQWFWTMDFRVVNNEHDAAFLSGQGIEYGILNINRIRLVNTLTGAAVSSFPTTAGESSIEIRTSEPLSMPNSNILLASGDSIDGTDKRLVEGQTVFISSTDSNPTVNGIFSIIKIDAATKTFRLLDRKGDRYNEIDLAQSYSAFTNGAEGIVKAWSLSDGSANSQFKTRIHNRNHTYDESDKVKDIESDGQRE